MVFKLVRTDSSDPCKIKLTVGTHLIGRGKFLDCEDKRVSRQHGELKVTQDSVSIKSLHANPCFYIRGSSDETVILKQECTITLNHGDKFGLLPHTYWYELLHCITEEDSESITDEVKNNNHVDLNYDENTEEPASNSDNAVETTQIVKTIDSESNKLDEDTNTSQPLNFELNETVDKDAEAPGSPSLIPQDENLDHGNTDEPSPTTDQNAESKATKRSNSVTSDESPVDVKKVKVEPDDSKDVKPDTTNDQTGSSGDQTADSNDVKPGPSNDQPGSSDGNNGDGMPPSPVKPPRERCMYGANCYRRNPQHKAQYSHPHDGDWGPGDRGQCPLGASCCRRDPRHWRDYMHPDGVVPPPPQARPGVPCGSDSDEDKSDENAQNGLIVTGKRVRRTIPRPTYSGSGSDNDPYGTDESDEWKPDSCDLLSTQSYSQNTED